MNSGNHGLAELWIITSNLSIHVSASNTTALVGRCLGACCIFLRTDLLDWDVDLYNARYVTYLHPSVVKSHVHTL